MENAVANMPKKNDKTKIKMPLRHSLFCVSGGFYPLHGGNTGPFPRSSPTQCILPPAASPPTGKERKMALFVIVIHLRSR
jgi:hypothetical protein